MRRAVAIKRHPREGGHPSFLKWAPAFAGVTLLFCLLSPVLHADSSLDSNVMPSSGLDSNVMPKHSYDSNQMPKSGIDSIPTTNADTKVDPRLCQQIIKHTPSADTNYQPGVDMHGNAVAPADVPGSTSQIEMPQKIDIPITVSLAKILNLNTSQFPNSALGTGTEAWIGTFSVEGDTVTFNGKPLTDAQQDNLAVLCMKPDK